MHHRRALGPIEHDQLQEVPRPIRTEDQVASGILINLLDDEGVAQDVLDDLQLDSVAKRRPEDLHAEIVLQNYVATNRKRTPACRSRPSTERAV